MDAKTMTTQTKVNSNDIIIKEPQPACIKFLLFTNKRCVLKYLPTAVSNAENPMAMKM